MKLTAILLVLFCTLSAQVVLSNQLSQRMLVKVRQVPSSTSTSLSAAHLATESAAHLAMESAHLATESAAAPSEASEIPATHLQSQAGNECSGSCSGNAIQWSDSIGSSSHGSHHHHENQDDNEPVMNIHEALGPIEHWIKAFKKRTKGDGGDLTGAAKAIVEPLIEKLKRNQKAAEDKLEQSNHELLERVQHEVTDHVLKLLKAKKIDDDHQEQSATREAKKEEAREESAEHESMRKLSEAVESASAETSKSIINHVKSELSKV